MGADGSTAAVAISAQLRTKGSFRKSQLLTEQWSAPPLPGLHNAPQAQGQLFRARHPFRVEAAARGDVCGVPWLHEECAAAPAPRTELPQIATRRPSTC